MGLILTRGAYAKPGTSLDYHTGSWRMQRPVHLHRPAPCHAACPAGEDAQAWLALVEEERFREAWETIVSRNPLPAVSGRGWVTGPSRKAGSTRLKLYLKVLPGWRSLAAGRQGVRLPGT